KRWSVSTMAILAVVAVSGPPGRAWAEGATLMTVKTGACALLTAADAQRLWDVPMHIQPGVPGHDFPARTRVYRPVKADAARRAVEFRLLDAREWADLRGQTFGKDGTADVSGIGDEAHFMRVTKDPRGSALVLFARRGSSQFSVRVAGTG